MFNDENGIGLNQPQWKHWVLQKGIKFHHIVGFGHANVVGPQVAVHGQGQQHDIEQTALDQGQIKAVQTVAHVADVGRTDHAIASKGSADG